MSIVEIRQCGAVTLRHALHDKTISILRHGPQAYQ
jgi:hypothetical protein